MREAGEIRRERLEGRLQAKWVAQGHLRKTRGSQKTWYGQTARQRIVSPGERVLVLLPASTSKLLAQWYAPYEVVGQVGRVNYLVAMPERWKEGIFHINMLRRWKEPSSMEYFVMRPGRERKSWRYSREMVGWMRSRPLGESCQGSRGEHSKHCYNNTKAHSPRCRDV